MKRARRYNLGTGENYTAARDRSIWALEYLEKTRPAFIRAVAKARHLGAAPEWRHGGADEIGYQEIGDSTSCTRVRNPYPRCRSSGLKATTLCRPNGFEQPAS